ncbi:hypothetical protein [Ferrimonas senticii]|nr:hypothetical protein [Ferrimonas senticii]
MFEYLLLALLAIPLTMLLRPVLSLAMAFVLDFIERKRGEQIDD